MHPTARLRRTVRTCCYAIAVAATAFAASAAAAASGVYGLWREPDMGALVELYPCDGGLCGRLVELPATAPVLDVNNPDPALQRRPLIGLQVVEGFRRLDDGQWIGGGADGAQPGRIYVPLNGDTLGDADNAYAITLAGPNSLTVGLHDCVMTCFLSSTWVRVTPDRRARDRRAKAGQAENP